MHSLTSHACGKKESKMNTSSAGLWLYAVCCLISPMVSGNTLDMQTSSAEGSTDSAFEMELPISTDFSYSKIISTSLDSYNTDTMGFSSTSQSDITDSLQLIATSLNDTIVSPSLSPTSQSEMTVSLDEWPTSQSEMTVSLDEWPTSQSEMTVSLDEWPTSQSEMTVSLDEWPTSQSEMTVSLDVWPTSQSEMTVSLDVWPTSQSEMTVSLDVWPTSQNDITDSLQLIATSLNDTIDSPNLIPTSQSEMTVSLDVWSTSQSHVTDELNGFFETDSTSTMNLASTLDTNSFVESSTSPSVVHMELSNSEFLSEIHALVSAATTSLVDDVHTSSTLHMSADVGDESDFSDTISLKMAISSSYTQPKEIVMSHVDTVLIEISDRNSEMFSSTVIDAVPLSSVIAGRSVPETLSLQTSSYSAIFQSDISSSVIPPSSETVHLQTSSHSAIFQSDINSSVIPHSSETVHLQTSSYSAIFQSEISSSVIPPSSETVHLETSSSYAIFQSDISSSVIPHSSETIHLQTSSYSAIFQSDNSSSVIPPSSGTVHLQTSSYYAIFQSDISSSLIPHSSETVHLQTSSYYAIFQSDISSSVIPHSSETVHLQTSSYSAIFQSDISSSVIPPSSETVHLQTTSYYAIFQSDISSFVIPPSSETVHLQTSSYSAIFQSDNSSSVIPPSSGTVHLQTSSYSAIFQSDISSSVTPPSSESVHLQTSSYYAIFQSDISSSVIPHSSETVHVQTSSYSVIFQSDISSSVIPPSSETVHLQTSSYYAIFQSDISSSVIPPSSETEHLQASSHSVIFQSDNRNSVIPTSSETVHLQTSTNSAIFQSDISSSIIPSSSDTVHLQTSSYSAVLLSDVRIDASQPSLTTTPLKTTFYAVSDTTPIPITDSSDLSTETLSDAFMTSLHILTQLSSIPIPTSVLTSSLETYNTFFTVDETSTVLPVPSTPLLSSSLSPTASLHTQLVDSSISTVDVNTSTTTKPSLSAPQSDLSTATPVSITNGIVLLSTVSFANIVSSSTPIEPTELLSTSWLLDLVQLTAVTEFNLSASVTSGPAIESMFSSAVTPASLFTVFPSVTSASPQTIPVTSVNVNVSSTSFAPNTSVLTMPSAIVSTASPEPDLNTTVLRVCYSTFPDSVIPDLFALAEIANCSGQIVSALGSRLAAIAFPLYTHPDIEDIINGSANALQPVQTDGFNRMFNCSLYDFTHYSNSSILSVVSTTLLTGVGAFKGNVQSNLTAAYICINSSLDPSVRQRYANRLTLVSSAYANISVALKSYADALLNAVRNGLVLCSWFKANRLIISQHALIESSGDVKGWLLGCATIDLNKSPVTGCNYTSDCNGDCNGTALFHPKCRLCYGGRTNYTLDTLTDCNGDCLGKATYDCSHSCSGGLTNRSAAIEDCAGVCNGTNQKDACGFCVAPTPNFTANESKYMDCTGQCFTRANMTKMAVKNKCNICVLGTTNLPLSYGEDACGVCGGNNSTCSDCEGHPNGGKTVDACWVCGGNGSICIFVTSATPNLIPSGQSKTISLTGAGFVAPVNCLAVSDNGSLNTTVVSVTSLTQLSLTLPDSLVVGEHVINCSSKGGPLSNSTALLQVYNSSVANVLSVSTNNFTIANGSSEVLQFTGSGFIQNSTFCKVTDSTGNTFFLNATVSNETNAACTLRHPDSSDQYTIQLTFNQLDPVGTTFLVTALAAAPSVTAKFSDDGGKIFIRFEPGASLSSDAACSDFISAANDALGNSAKCSVISPLLVVVENSEALAKGNFTLKYGAIRANNERFSNPAIGSVTIAMPDNPVKPEVVLIGPEQVSACVNSFVIDARRSSGLGGRLGWYTWTVFPDVETVGSSSPVLTITNTSLVTFYTISLQLCNFFNMCVNAQQNVTKSTSNAPDVVIEALVDVSKVRPSDRFDLVANATLYKGCVDDVIVFSWTFTPRLEKDNYASRAAYSIEPGALAAPQNYTATVTAALSSNRSIYSTASITINTKLSDLYAIIDGAEIRTVGIDSGVFTLDASRSLDPDGRPESMMYKWSCIVLDTNEVCQDASNHVIPKAEDQIRSILSLSSSDLEPNKRYKFAVVVSKSSGNSIRSQTASVTVETTAGDPPKILLSLENDEFGKYSIDDVVTVTAILTSYSKPTVVWNTISETGYGYINLTDSAIVLNQKPPELLDSASRTYIAYLSIRPGVLARGTRYRVHSTVTDVAQQSARATVSFYIYNGVTSCQLIITGNNYTELSPIAGNTERCFSDADGYPLTYGYFVVTNQQETSFERLTKPSPYSSLEISFGPQAYFPGYNIFAVKVCAAKGGCNRFFSGRITVIPFNSRQLTERVLDAINTVHNLKKSGNPMSGIMVLKTMLHKTNSGTSRRKRSTVTSTPEMNALVLDLANETMATTYPSQNVLDTVLDGLGSLPPADSSAADLDFQISLYEKITESFDSSEDATLKPEHVAQIKKFTNTVVRTLGIKPNRVSNLTASISIASRKKLPFLTFEEIDIGNGKLTYLVNVTSSSQRSKSNGSAVLIDFGESLAANYTRWSCGASSLCLGVGIEISHYDTDSDPYFTDNSRASDIIEIKLFNQESGSDLHNISGLIKPVSIAFPLTRPSSGTYVCKYWDTETSQWLTDGVTTVLQTSSTVVCNSTHLTGFGVSSENPSSPKETLIGGVVGGVVGALCIATIVVLAVMNVKKKNRVGSATSTRRLVVQPTV